MSISDFSGRKGESTVGRWLRVDQPWQRRGGDMDSVSQGYVPLLPLRLFGFVSNLEVIAGCFWE